MKVKHQRVAARVHWTALVTSLVLLTIAAGMSLWDLFHM